MTKLTAELDRGNHTWTLKLIGSVDSGTAQHMWFYDSSASLLAELVRARAKTLFIDLLAAEAIDSHGLRHLLNAQKEFSRANVEIVLQKPNPHLKRLFRIMQFDRVFVVESDE
jgi:anti-anti-sigma factor